MFNFNIAATVDTDVTVEVVIQQQINNTILDGVIDISEQETRGYFLGSLGAGDIGRFEEKLIKRLGKPSQEVYDALDRITAVTRPMNFR